MSGTIAHRSGAGAPAAAGGGAPAVDAAATVPGPWTRRQRAPREAPAPRERDGAAITGTADVDYDLMWFTQACLGNALRLEAYIADAERAGDEEAESLFRRAQAESRRGAEFGKALLARRLAGGP